MSNELPFIEELKYQFFFEEIFQASINASFSTRNAEYPIYNSKGPRSNHLKSSLRELIKDYVVKFKSHNITEEDHFIEIEKIYEIISVDVKHAQQLHQSKFRIGTSQKL